MASLTETISEVVVETVKEMHPEPVPEGIIYAAFQSVQLSLDIFNSAVDHAIGTGAIKKGPLPHSLVVA